MAKAQTNKLSVYLIRTDCTEPAKMLRSNPSRKEQAVSGLGTFYYQSSAANPPGWISRFFGASLSNTGLFTAIAKGLFVVEVQVSEGVKRSFAIGFGQGWQLLEPTAIEERFGLRVVLNSVEPNSLRRIGKKNLAATPKDTHEQVSQASGIAAFGVDIEQDLIRDITGVSRIEALGRTISGSDRLSVSVPIDLLNIRDFLQLCYKQFQLSAYKENFGWVDQIAEIKDGSKIAQLDEQLLNRVQAQDHGHTWMAVPELIDWEDISGFKYRQSKRAVPTDDIYLEEFLASLSDEDRESLTIDTLKKKYIYAYSASTGFDIRRWSAYKCLYCEIQDKGRTFLLSNGKWFEVEENFAKNVDDDFVNLRDAADTCSLPPYNHKSEGDYNLSTSLRDSNYCCLDGPKHTIAFGGGHGSIEFCDLLAKDKKFVHVKRYGSSAVLSHLFSQGVVPAELFVQEAEFRQKLNEKLPASHKLSDTSTQPNARDYEVVYAIISSKDEALEIPFFSKVTLRNAARRLRGYGYNVRLQKIGTQEKATAAT